jgi:hypothetical protein
MADLQIYTNSKGSKQSGSDVPLWEQSMTHGKPRCRFPPTMSASELALSSSHRQYALTTVNAYMVISHHQYNNTKGRQQSVLS